MCSLPFGYLTRYSLKILCIFGKAKPKYETKFPSALLRLISPIIMYKNMFAAIRPVVATQSEAIPTMTRVLIRNPAPSLIPSANNGECENVSLIWVTCRCYRTKRHTTADDDSVAQSDFRTTSTGLSRLGV